MRAEASCSTVLASATDVQEIPHDRWKTNTRNTGTISIIAVR